MKFEASFRLSHNGVRVSSGGTGADAWYVFERTQPRPEKAPLAIMMHGYYEFAGYNQLYELIHHTVRKGSIVIYPRWQTDVAVPCPGPIDIEPSKKRSPLVHCAKHLWRHDERRQATIPTGRRVGDPRQDHAR